MHGLRKVVITGGVAVGKSTIIKQCQTELQRLGKKCVIVPEYIDVKEDGLEMLNKYLRKEITVYTFQKYILDYYDWYLGQLKLDGDEIVIFERALDDAITCFSNLDHAAGRLATEEFYALYMAAKGIDLKYGIPSFFLEQNYIFFSVKTQDTTKDGNLIAAIIDNRSSDNIIIGLYNSNQECYRRLHERNRPGEVDSYPLATIANFNGNYRNLYNRLMSGGNLKFTDLGRLLPTE